MEEGSIMKKYLAMIVAGMLFACCLGLAACGSSSSSASASASSASESASSASAESSSASAESSSASAEVSESAAASAAASASAASAEASAASAEASAASADASDVSPEFKEFCARYTAACDELEAVVNKAKEAGSYEAVEQEWNAASALIGQLGDEAADWAKKYSNGDLSQADKDYYDKVLVPIALKSANTASEMLDLIGK